MTYIKKLSAKRELRRSELDKAEKAKPDQGLSGRKDGLDPTKWKPAASAQSAAVRKRLEQDHGVVKLSADKANPASPEQLMPLVSTLNQLGAPEALLTRSPKLREMAPVLDRLTHLKLQLGEKLPEALKARLGSLVPELLQALEGAHTNVKDEREFEASLEVVEKVIADLPKTDEESLEAFVLAARATSKAEPQDLAQQLTHAWAQIRAAGPQRALAAMDAVEKTAILGTPVSAAFTLALEALAKPQAPAQQLVDALGRKVSQSQQAALLATVAQSRAGWETSQHTRAEAKAVRNQVAPELRDVIDRAAGLVSSEALATLASVLNQPGEPTLKRAQAEVALAVLRDGASAQVVAQMAPDLARFAQFGPQLAVRAAHIYPADQLAGIFHASAAILEQLPAEKRAMLTPAALQSFCDGIAASRGAFSQGEGPVAILVPALLNAPDAATLQNLLRAGPSIAAALHFAEGGDVRTSLTASFFQNVQIASAAGVDLQATAIAHRSIAPEALPLLIASGLKRNNLAETLSAADRVFKALGTKKDEVRVLRSLVTLVEQGGGDSSLLLGALGRSNLKPKEYASVAKAMLSETPPTVNPDKVQEAIGLLAAGHNPAPVIRDRMQAAMVKNLALNALIADAKLKLTDQGLAQVTGPMASFFATGAANPAAIPPPLLKGLMVSVLEDRFGDLRFQSPASQAQLKSLNPAQLKMWKAPETMAHVRFRDDGQVRFDQRVKDAANVGKELLKRLEAKWGPLVQLEARQAAFVTRLRAVPKDQVEARAAILKEMGTLPDHLEALHKALKLSTLTPEGMTPLRFEKLGEEISSLSQLGDLSAATELRWLFRIDDLPYSEVLTNDGPSLADIERLIVRLGTCVRWPSSEALAFMVDANKRVVTTRNQAGEERRAILRLVERKDPGHEGQPMLVLERAYPDTQNADDKLRLMEHALRRAAEMKIPIGFPTEYYWDASKTGRALRDMNAQLEDLNRRYGTTSKKEQLKVMSPAGNTPFEYIDSAPTSLQMVGQIGVRKYPGTQDNTYENIFLMLEPK
jgi:hypothetical protein